MRRDRRILRRARRMMRPPTEATTDGSRVAIMGLWQGPQPRSALDSRRLLNGGAHVPGAAREAPWLAGMPGGLRTAQRTSTGSATGAACSLPDGISSPHTIAPAAKIAADHQNAVV